jgi:hypothetical protein
MSYYFHWHNLKHDASRRAEKMLMWVVWKLPRKVVYWSAIRVGANATTGQYSNQVVPELLFTDALKRWDST